MGSQIVQGLIDFCTDFGLCSKGYAKKVTLIRFLKISLATELRIDLKRIFTLRVSR